MRPFDGTYESRQKSSHECLRQLGPFFTLTFQMFYLQKICQGGKIFAMRSFDGQISKFYKSLPIIALATIFSEILTFRICDLKTIGQGRRVKFSQ